MIGADIYRSGRYIEHFQPDADDNPLRRLYAAKRRDVLAAIRQRLAPGAAVLDLGGGPGRMSVPLADAYQVTLGDVSEQMLEIARQRALRAGVPSGNLRFLAVDAAQPLPFPAASFDAALCIDLLPHLPAPVSVLRELARVLKPGGDLVVDASNRSPWLLLRYPRLLGRRPSRWASTWRSGGVAPEWQSNVSHHHYGEYRSLLAAAGLVPVEEWTYGPRWSPKWFLARCQVMHA